MIRKAKMEELDEILSVYDFARNFMRESGNPTQWAGGYPKRELLTDDIEKGQLYVVEEEGEITGVFAYIGGRDKTYAYIEDGAWLSDEPYKTIHRVGAGKNGKGIMKKVCDFCKEDFSNLRIDTHNDNKKMQYLIEKNGFKRCGIIYVEDGSPRIAYQYIKE